MTTNAMPPTRPFYWSMRREVWENRSIYIAPLAAAALGLVAFLFSLRRLPQTLGAEHDPVDIIMPYSHLSMLLVLTVFLVGIFYALEALHGERRERSILFWKSLPVSDTTTVLAKASIPLLLMPLLAFVVGAAAQLLMVLLSLAAVLTSRSSGVTAVELWRQLPLFQMQLTLLYELAVVALWHAPLYGWLLLVSGWARRATFLWALLPPLALGVFEFFAFRTTYVFHILADRLFGFATKAFTLRTPSGEFVDPHMILLPQLTPASYLSSPGLWIGLVAAAVLIAAAIRLRRYRGPA